MKLIVSLIIALTAVTYSAKSELIPFLDDDQKLGYMNEQGGIVIEPEFEQDVSYVRYIYEGEVYPGVEFPPYTYFNEGLATIRDATHLFFITLWYNYFVIDTTGKKVFKTGDNIAYNFNEGLAPLKLNETAVDILKPRKFWTWVDKTGKEFQPIKNKISYVSQFKEGYALVLTEDNYGFIDKEGNFLNNPIYEDATLFSEGRASVKVEGKWGYINKKGEIVIKNKFDNAYQYFDGVARVMDKGAFGYINLAGDYVVPAKYLWATDFSNGLAAVMIDKTKYGYIDKTGKLTINQGFTMARKFSDGLGCVQKDGKWGFVNAKGEWVVKPTYEFALSFNHGAAMVWTPNQLFLINTKGEKLSVLLNSDAYAQVKRNLKP